MKVAFGFISNSSSSTYLLIGIECPSKLILTRIGYDEDDDNHGFGKWIHPKYDLIELIENYGRPDILGYDIGPGLEKNKTLSKLKKEFITLLKNEFDIVITPEELKLYFGESSS
jgi:hypothetical protein